MKSALRVVGMLAYLNERASRFRANGIPTNWLVIFLLLVFTGLSYTQVHEAYSNSSTPDSVTLIDITAGGTRVDRQVTVSGRLYIDEALAAHPKGKEEHEPEEIWVPLVDAERGVGVYVHVRDLEEEPHGIVHSGAKTLVTGMLRKLDRELSSELSVRPRRVAEARMSREYMVVVGEPPAGRTLSSLVFVSLIGAMLLMVGLSLMRNTIFVPAAPSISPLSAKPATAPQPDELDARATGTFVLGEHHGYFIEVPGALAELEGGQKAVLANIDASVRMYGHITDPRAGTWAMVIRPGSQSASQMGTVYFGMHVRPAVRLRYVDDALGYSRRMVVSFPDEGQRNRFVSLLTATVSKAS